MRFVVLIRRKIVRNILLVLMLFAMILLVLIPAREGKIPVLDAFSQTRKLPIYSVETNTSSVAITFDCAWGADDIPEIIKILKTEDVKASFFAVGQWAERNPDAVKMIVQNGHDIGNHGYSHLKMSTISEEKCKYEIEKCNKVIGDISGTKVQLFRPPYGDYNDTVIRACFDIGCYPIQWNIDSLDWKREMSRSAILDRVVSKTKPGSIILFHNDTQYTVELLPKIIQELKGKGLSFLPVSNMIFKSQYHIDDQGRQKSVTR